MNEINFIPSTYFETRARRNRLVRSAVLLFAAVGTMVVWQVLAPPRHEEALDGYVATLDAQIERERTARDLRDAASAERSDLEALVELQSRLEPALPTTWIMGTISELMPPAMGLTGFALSCTPVDSESREDDGFERDTGAEPAAIDLSLEGLAPDDVTIAKFIGGLDGQAVFDGVELGFSRPLEEGPLIAREFQLTASIPLNRTFVLAGTEEGADAD